MNESTGDLSTDCQSLGSRRYSREYLLEIKDRICSGSGSFPISFLADSKVLFKILKPGCKALEELSRSNGDKSIVLGPLKRVWNNGCHVSQSKRCPSDSPFAKSHRGFPERKPRGDCKRESRGTDRNFNRTIFSNDSDFNRVRKGVSVKNRSSESANETEAEPEWFTEGPETINDTMELGMIIEDCEVKLNESKEGKNTGVFKVKPSDIDSAILSIDINTLPPDASALSSDLNESELLELLSLNKRRFDGNGSIKSVDPTHPTTITNKQNDNPRTRLLDFLQRTEPVSCVIPSSKTDANLGSELKKLLIGNVSAGLDVPPLQDSIPFAADIECRNPTSRALPTAPPLPNAPTLLDRLSAAMGINERQSPHHLTGEITSQSLLDLLNLLQLKTSNIAPSGSEPRMNKAPLDDLAQNLRSNVNVPCARDHFGTPISQINNRSSRPLPDDPAIDLNFIESSSTLRSIYVDEALQPMQRHHLAIPSTYSSNYCMGVGDVQNQNPVYHSITTNIPQENPSYLPYSSNPVPVATPAVSLRRPHNRHEHLLPFSTGGAAPPTSRVADLPPTGLYAQVQQQRRWPNEAPDSVMPPSASAADLYLYDQAVARNVGLYDLNTDNLHTPPFGRRAS